MRGSAAGILLLLLAVIGLVALFSGNLDRLITAFAGPAGGAEGLTAGGASSAVQDRSPQPAAAPPATSGGAQAADAARRGGFRED